MDSLFYAMLKQVEFLNENMIGKDNWIIADQLTSNVDHKDIAFVALALQEKALLWTGDKKLSGHLSAHGFNQVINTAELYSMLDIG